MAFGVIRLPRVTFGLFNCFSAYAFCFFGFGVMLGAGVEDGFDGEEEFGKVGGGPFRKAANKTFNHSWGFTF